MNSIVVYVCHNIVVLCRVLMFDIVCSSIMSSKVKEFIVAYTKLLQRSEIPKTWPAHLRSRHAR